MPEGETTLVCVCVVDEEEVETEEGTEAVDEEEVDAVEEGAAAAALKASVMRSAERLCVQSLVA